ncbi:MAG TPA: hypothetical protein VMY99_04170 [Nevskiaceae bacterium]|nr:hypothetical protein [Nevskiaceae bacterium]
MTRNVDLASSHSAETSNSTSLLVVWDVHPDEIEINQAFTASLKQDNPPFETIQGNVLAAFLGKRQWRKNLNNCFPPDFKTPIDLEAPVYEKLRAAYICRAMKFFDLVVGLHGATSDLEYLLVSPHAAPLVQGAATIFNEEGYGRGPHSMYPIIESSPGMMSHLPNAMDLEFAGDPEENISFLWQKLGQLAAMHPKEITTRARMQATHTFLGDMTVQEAKRLGLDPEASYPPFTSLSDEAPQHDYPPGTRILAWEPGGKDNGDASIIAELIVPKAA